MIERGETIIGVPLSSPAHPRIRIWLLHFTIGQKNHSRLINASNEAWTKEGRGEKRLSSRSRRVMENEKWDTKERKKERKKKRQRRRRGKILKISLGLLAVYTFPDNQRGGIDCTNAAREAFRITVRNNLHPPVSRRLAVTVIAIPRRHFDPTFDRTTNAFSNEMRIDTR